MATLGSPNEPMARRYLAEVTQPLSVGLEDAPRWAIWLVMSSNSLNSKCRQCPTVADALQIEAAAMQRHQEEVGDTLATTLLTLILSTSEHHTSTETLQKLDKLFFTWKCGDPKIAPTTPGS